MEIQSRDFTQNGTISREYTCDGANVSPPLTFENPPPEAESLALILMDTSPRDENFYHWIVWNIPMDVYNFRKGMSTGYPGSFPKDCVMGENDYGEVSYRGPCPPESRRHRYQFTLYALEEQVALVEGEDKRKFN
ncbi:MAG: YbhB/YbcL family Raf kinase inhibitor-like protein, partial [bacterium]